MKRIVFLDYVRVFACFLVMVVHASENFYGAAGSTDMAGPQSFLASEAETIINNGTAMREKPSYTATHNRSAGTDEGGTDFMAVLPPTLHSYPATVFYIYDTL